MDLGLLKDIATIVATTAGAVGLFRHLVYFTNSRLRRAEWLASL